MTMQTSQKFIIDTSQVSRAFREAIEQVIFPEGVIFEPQQQLYYKTTEEFLVKECTNQIFLILGPDVNEFLLNLLSFPDYKYFEHVPHFREPEIKDFFTKAFKEYALGLLFCIQSSIGLNSDNMYLLDAFGLDFVIVNVITNHPH